MGRALCGELAREGVAVCVLSRDPDRAQRAVPEACSYHLWQPIERGTAWIELVAQARAIVHLASPLAVPGRWTHARRQELYDSCVMGTRGIVSAVAQARRRPEVLVCASSVAYYAFDARGEQQSGEEASAGDDFLSRLAADWEAEAMRAEQFGVRTVVVRTALVLGPEGALPRLKRAARMGMGGPVSPGCQRQPWIHVQDEVGLLVRALGDGRVTGPLNGVAPHSVTAAEFMRALCASVGTTTGMSPPDWLLHSRLGPGALAVTHGRGAVPTRALELGYAFQHPELEEALHQALAATAA